MTGRFLKILRWLFILIIALGVAALISHEAKEDQGGPLLLSLSFEAGQPQVPVTVSFLNNELELEIGQLPSGYAIHNTLTFQFPEQTQIDSLVVSTGTNDTIKISAFSITCGSFHRSYTGVDLLTSTIIEDCGVLRGHSGQVNLIHQKGLVSFLFDYEICLLPKDRFCFIDDRFCVDNELICWFDGWLCFRASEFHRRLFLGFFFVILVLQILICRKLKPGAFFKLGILSLVMAVLLGYILLLLRENVPNAEISVKYSNSGVPEAEFEMYYSPDGIFRNTKLIEGLTNHDLEGEVNFSLPNGIHNHLRLDVPKDDTIVLEEISIGLWPLNRTMRGQEIVTSFPFLNDLSYGLNSEGDLVLQTGKLDPYLYFADSSFTKGLIYWQHKKIQYPIWIAIVFYLIFLIILVRSTDLALTLFALGFSLILIIPGISFLFKEDVLRLETEKRLAFPRPSVWENTQELILYTTAYLDDQFGGRAGLITAWNILRVMAFNQTDHSAAVVIGSDEWMYYKAEGVQEVYENKIPFRDDELSKMCTVLQERQLWLDAYGIDYYIVFPPIKHTIYPEYLPQRIKRANKYSKLDQLINYLDQHSTIKVIDPRKTLIEAKQKEKRPLYYRFDSHWNLLGSHYAYTQIINTIREDHPEVVGPMDKSNFIWYRLKSEDGDLAKLLSLNTYFRRSEIVPEPWLGYCADSVASLYYPSHESFHEVVTREVTDTALPKMVMNRDSYSNFLFPYMSEHFERSVYLWTPLFNAEVIKQEMPDIMITEMLERFISDLMIDNPPIVRHELDSMGIVIPILEP